MSPSAVPPKDIIPRPGGARVVDRPAWLRASEKAAVTNSPSPAMETSTGPRPVDTPERAQRTCRFSVPLCGRRAAGGARAVYPLVVRGVHRGERGQEFAAGEHALGAVRVEAHLLGLARTESRLVPDTSRRGQRCRGSS
ncbi:MAG: hypothetical protein K0Q93_961 [Nocardioidaceae bacterium]|jgi:hypothetical protein|nr:hypothetical protein [Nocardioidaceae bacterium]